MISKEELIELKQKRRINLYYLEKEYLQYIFLNAIFKYSDKVVFKGGTCLRICYQLERASEDLDFSSSLNIVKLKELIKNCLKEFDLLGIEHLDLIEKEFEGNIRFEIRFKGPLFNGNLNSANNLKVDFNKNKVFNKNTVVVKQIFSDVPNFVLVALAEKEILAEKIRAIANRKQARDLYDLWILLGKKVEIDKILIKNKLKEEKTDLSKIKILSKGSYEQELKNLISFVPDYEQVKKDIEKFLEQLK